MREIKFRAKALKGKKLIYFDLFALATVDGTLYANAIAIDPKTIQLYTGLKDKNGKEIYEGDICKYWADGVWKIGYIIWQRGGFAINIKSVGEELIDIIFEFQSFIPTPAGNEGIMMGNEFEVIGNIYENPELLKEVK